MDFVDYRFPRHLHDTEIPTPFLTIEISGEIMLALTSMTLAKVAALAALFLLSGCVTEQAAPGASAVTLTRNAADVANCTAVGNVKAYAPNGVGDEVKFRNQVVGYGGNVGFVTLNGACGIGACQTAAEGVAYRCPANRP